MKTLYSLILSLALAGSAAGQTRRAAAPLPAGIPGVSAVPSLGINSASNPQTQATLTHGLISAPQLPPVSVLGAPAAAAPEAPQAAPAAIQVLGAAAPQAPPGETPSAKDQHRLSAAFDGLGYPKTRRDETVVDDYFGAKIADPYRWLEDDNSAETKAWVDAQNQHSESYLAKIPERKEIAERLKEMFNYERFSTPEKLGKYWIYSHNSGLQNQSILYKARRLYGPREVLLDPNTLSADGTAALGDTSFSDDGRYLAYSIAKAGSDWTQWRVRDVETGKDLPDVLDWTKFTRATWTKDHKGFYYTRYPEPKAGDEGKQANINSKVYYHALGTKQTEDALIYERPDHPTWGFSLTTTGRGRFMLLYQREGTEPKNRIYIKDTSKAGSKFEPLFGDFDASYSIIASNGNRLYVHTTKDAPRGRLIVVDRRDPRPSAWKDVIAQSKDRSVLESVRKVGDKFVAVWSTDAHQTMKVYGPRGGFKYEVALPSVGSVSGFSRKGDKDQTRGFFTFSSFNHPRTVMRLNLETGKTRGYRRPKIDFDPTKFEVKQVFYPSKDGTKIPMFIVHKKGLLLNGQNPTYLYGYGGFGISLNPSFSGSNAAWLERGGVYAVANLRGGGEYGQEWHDAGRLNNKQNVFDDFIAAAEYLIAQKYTSTPKLAVGGGSNGGLLIGAVMTQRPDLFAAAVPQVGVLDMLRFHLFTVGRGWKSDYGSSETKEGFDTLIKYSPLHNVKPGTAYPATLVMTGDHDDRVVPAHSHKFTATLQAAQAGIAPILTRIAKDAGHGAGKPMGKIIEEAADMWAFLLRALGVSR